MKLKSNLCLYVSDSMPNGTQCLFVVSRDFKVIDALDEAVFGVRCNFDQFIFNDEIFMMSEDITPEDLPVSPVSIVQVLKHIAVSPVSDGSETIEFLKKYCI